MLNFFFELQLRMTSYRVDNVSIKENNCSPNTNVTLSGVEVLLIRFQPFITTLHSVFLKSQLKKTASLSLNAVFDV